MKRYIAILNQNGQQDPVATILENSLGNIVWTRAEEGQYLGTLVGGFPSDTTVAFIGCGQGGEAATITTIELPANSKDYIVVTTKDVVAETGSFNFSDQLLVR